MISFDPTNRVVQLDRFEVSASEIWTAYVDWAATGDNFKYGIVMTQIGGVPPVALYLYLQLGWKIRPIEADGVTTITGNLLVEGGGSPIVSTVGNFNTLVNMETPVQAVAVNSGSGSAGSATLTQQNIRDIADAVWNEVL